MTQDTKLNEIAHTLGITPEDLQANLDATLKPTSQASEDIRTLDISPTPSDAAITVTANLTIYNPKYYLDLPDLRVGDTATVTQCLTGKLELPLQPFHLYELTRPDNTTFMLLGVYLLPYVTISQS